MIVFTHAHVAIVAMLSTSLYPDIAFFAQSFSAETLLVHGVLLLLRICQILISDHSRVASGNQKVRQAHSPTDDDGGDFEIDILGGGEYETDHEEADSGEDDESRQEAPI